MSWQSDTWTSLLTVHRGARCQLLVTWHLNEWRRDAPHSRALRVGFWWSARLVKGAARVWACLRLGAAVSGSARRQSARGGAGALPASGWRLCTGCRDARAAAPALRTLAPGGGGLGAAGAGLNAPWEAFEHRCDAGATLASELPYPGRSAPRRLQAVRAARERCGARLGVAAARRGGCSVGGTWRDSALGARGWGWEGALSAIEWSACAHLLW